MRYRKGSHQNLERFGDFRGKDQPGAVTQSDGLSEENGLKVFGVAGSSGDRDLLPTQQGVDQAALTDIGMTESAQGQELLSWDSELQFQIRDYLK